MVPAPVCPLPELPCSWWPLGLQPHPPCPCPVSLHSCAQAQDFWGTGWRATWGDGTVQRCYGDDFWMEKLSSGFCGGCHSEGDSLCHFPGPLPFEGASGFRTWAAVGDTTGSWAVDSGQPKPAVPSPPPAPRTQVPALPLLPAPTPATEAARGPHGRLAVKGDPGPVQTSAPRRQRLPL